MDIEALSLKNLKLESFHKKMKKFEINFNKYIYIYILNEFMK